MVKKKEMSGRWIVIDENNQIHYYSNFNEALKHPGRRASIMTEEFYKTRYEDIIRKRLEEKGMAEVKNLHQHQQTGTIIPPEEALMNIIKQGATEFEKETGRKMSYGEMREMYG